MATTSSGRSRHPKLWFASAAALAAAVFFRVADPRAGSAPELRPRRAPAAESATAIPAATRVSVPNPTPEQRINADAIECALLAANTGARDLVLERMLSTWVPDDPQSAARFAELLTDSFLREAALRTVAQVWTHFDRDSAAHWAASLSDDTERDHVIEVVALAIGGSDPHTALALLDRQWPDERPHPASVGVVSSWASQDFPAAQSWLEAQPPSPSRDGIVLRLAFLRAQTDPLAATQLVNRMLDDEKARRDAYASIIGPWAAQDPDGARDWAASADAETGRRVEAELAITGQNSSPD